MKPMDRRKFEQQLRSLCRRSKLDVSIDKKAGSHRGIVIRDPATGQAVTIVITSHKTVSPGVQRNIYDYLADLASRLPVAEIVRAILEAIFR